MKKYVLITGSNGLVGSESVRFFIKKNFFVIGVDNNQRKKTWKIVLALRAARSLKAMHDKNIIHGDIKAENYMLDGDNGDGLDELKNIVLQDPQNKQKRFQLAEKYLLSNEIESGFNELLQLFSQDSKWNDEAAKKKLLEYFDLLGFSDPNVLEARKKLSTLMFK